MKECKLLGHIFFIEGLKKDKIVDGSLMPVFRSGVTMKLSASKGILWGVLLVTSLFVPHIQIYLMD